MAHLGGRITKAGWRAKENRIVVLQFGRGRYRCGLVRLGVEFFQRVSGKEFSYAFDIHSGMGNGARAGSDGGGQLLDMPPGAVVENKNFAQRRPPVCL